MKTWRPDFLFSFARFRFTRVENQPRSQRVVVSLFFFFLSAAAAACGRRVAAAAAAASSCFSSSVVNIIIVVVVDERDDDDDKASISASTGQSINKWEKESHKQTGHGSELFSVRISRS